MSQACSAVRSLENVRERVKQRLTKVPEYRAFLAVEAPIAEVAEIPDLLAHLETAKQRILDRLALKREYQALITVDKTIKDIAEVLEIVGEEASLDAAPAQSVAPTPPAKAQTAVSNGPTVVGLSLDVRESCGPQLLASEVR